MIDRELPEGLTLDQVPVCGECGIHWHVVGAGTTRGMQVYRPRCAHEQAVEIADLAPDPEPQGGGFFDALEPEADDVGE